MTTWRAAWQSSAQSSAYRGGVDADRYRWREFEAPAFLCYSEKGSHVRQSWRRRAVLWPVTGSNEMILVTGGAGFIGSNLVHHLLRGTGESVVNVDKLTYAGNLQNLTSVWNDKRHAFVRGDIADGDLIGNLFAEHQPRAVLNLAAESHVDRSIHDPESFVQTNVVGTF